MALDRLDNTFEKQRYEKAIVIVLSDGHLNSADTDRSLWFAEQFNKRGWPLYITGDRGTSKNLLIAANKGRIYWSSISEANPAMWIQQARESLKHEEDNAAGQQVDQKKEDVLRIGRSRNRLRVDASKEEPDTPSIENIDLQHANEDPRRDVSNSLPEDIKARFRTELDVTVSGGQLRNESTDVNLPAPEDSTKTSLEEDATPILSAEPNIQAEPLVSAQSPEMEQPEKSQKPSIWPRAKRILGNVWLWVGATCLIPCTALGYLIVRGNQKAKEWATSRKTALKDKPNSDGMVVATFNGRSQHLGTKSRLPVIHVGSGINNTVRIPEKGISDRHLRIYRQGQELMVQNIGATPITVRERQLTPKAKQRLVLPTAIELTKNTKLRLSLLNAKNAAAPERSKDHEKTK